MTSVLTNHPAALAQGVAGGEKFFRHLDKNSFSLHIFDKNFYTPVKKLYTFTKA